MSYICKGISPYIPTKYGLNLYGTIPPFQVPDILIDYVDVSSQDWVPEKGDAWFWTWPKHDKHKGWLWFLTFSAHWPSKHKDWPHYTDVCSSWITFAAFTFRHLSQRVVYIALQYYHIWLHLVNQCESLGCPPNPPWKTPWCFLLHLHKFHQIPPSWARDRPDHKQPVFFPVKTHNLQTWGPFTGTPGFENRLLQVIQCCLIRVSFSFLAKPMNIKWISASSVSHYITVVGLENPQFCWLNKV